MYDVAFSVLWIFVVNKLHKVLHSWPNFTTFFNVYASIYSRSDLTAHYSFGLFYTHLWILYSCTVSEAKLNMLCLFPNRRYSINPRHSHYSHNLTTPSQPHDASQEGSKGCHEVSMQGPWSCAWNLRNSWEVFQSHTHKRPVPSPLTTYWPLGLKEIPHA